MMKKKLIILSIIIILILITVNIIFGTLVIKKKKIKCIDFNYDTKWKELSSDDSSVLLVNGNNSNLYLSIRNIDKNYIDSDIEDIYYAYEEEYRQNNSNFKLLDFGQTIIGSDYFNANSYYYNSSTHGSLLIIGYYNKYIIEINYSALLEYFDYDLGDIYPIINNISISC